MYKIDKNKAKEILLKEFKYDEVSIDQFLDRYPELFDELGECVNSWMTDRSVPNIVKFGVTLKELVELNNGNLFIAARDMNKLFDKDIDDQTARDWISVLRSPHTVE